jgi:energy-coupling factor transporter ATP-binding protein EcfA2
VELTPNKDTLIRNLSGGQRKRASIAVELLSDPNLFFLDEPASGLDPGTERNLMMTLKNMTDDGKTVVFVTHSTLNLHLCDKIAFMGKGGKLCFYGSLDQALEFFGLDDIVNVYDMLYNEVNEWQARYNNTKKEKTVVPELTALKEQTNKESSKKERIKQTLVLCKRHFHILFNDKIRLLLLALQAPILAVLIAFVADGNQFDDYRITRSLLFALSCSAFWIGTLNSIQEICKERNILKREYMTGVRLDSYIFSKIIMLAVLCAVQSLMLITVFALTIGVPETGLIMSPFIELFVTTFMTSIAASAMGIFVSSMFKNADRAMTVAPFLLMPQLLFSGLIFHLEGISNVISYLVVCRWSMEGFGTTANLNVLDTITREGLRVPNEYEAFYDFSVFHLMSRWVILFIFVILFSFLAGLILRNINKERGR